MKIEFKEKFLIINKILIKEIGLKEAIIFQQIYYWVENNMKNNQNYYKNRYWTYNSIEFWQENYFDYLSVNEVRKAFNNLEKEEYIISDNFNKNKFNRTKWYTINEEKLEEFNQKYQKINITKNQKNDKDLEILKKINENYNFNNDMLNIAIDISIKNLNRINYPYINGILKNWLKNKIFSISDLKENQKKQKENKKYYKKISNFNNFSQRDDDLDAQIKNWDI